MKSTKIASNLQKSLQDTLKCYPSVFKKIIDAIACAGGKALLVGGAVRDVLLGKSMHDLDIEVHHISYAALEAILAAHGAVQLVGKAYGVFRINGLDIDWSVPRRDAAGRKPTVAFDPAMSYAEAFRRRDLTMNAMGIDIQTFELIDPFQGAHDLERRVLRCPDVHLFAQDPLRFFRVMQFMGRFGMEPDAELHRVCATMSLVGIARERIESEFHKLMLYAPRPSVGVRWLHTLKRLPEILPELAALVGVEQDPRWHPEGDVFEHSMQTLDASTVFTYDDEKITLAVRYAALCHDLGKATTTTVDAAGMVHAYGHEKESERRAQSLMNRITTCSDVQKNVLLLVRHHMAPGLFIKDGAKPAAYKRLARALGATVNVSILADLACADRRGRNLHGPVPLQGACTEIELFRERARAAGVSTAPEPPLLTGKDFLDHIAPSPALGKVVKRAYELQLERGITDKQRLYDLVLAEHHQEKN